MEYKIWKKKFKNAQNQEQEKYFACKTTRVTVTTAQLIEEIVLRSSFSAGDIKGVLAEINTSLAIHLPLGHNVNIDDLGTYSMTITSNMIDSPADISKLKIRGNRIVYKPASSLLKLLNNIHFLFAGEKQTKKEQE